MAKARPKYIDLELTARGFHFRLSDEEIETIEQIIDEDGFLPCTLERERDNEVDPYAIKVIGFDPKRKRFKDVHLAYVGRPANESLSELMRRGGTIKVCSLVYIDPESGEGDLEVTVTRPDSKRPANG